MDKTTGIISIPSVYAVKETMDKLEAALRAHGITIYGRIDQEADIVDMIRQKYYTEIEALDKLRTKHLRRIVDTLQQQIDIDLAAKDLGRHEKLWQITDQVVTTNYDKALEKVAPNRSRTVVYEDAFHVADLSGIERFLYKAHGSIERPGECVLFSEQYNKLYDGKTGATLELFRILADKTIIFLGFSLNDPFVNKLLELRKNAYNGFKQHHFIITMDDKDFSGYGVERIEGVNNYGADLDEFLDELVLIREKYPYGLGMLIRGLVKEGKGFNEEVVRKNYFEFLASMEKQPETASVAEEVKAGKFENAEDKLKAELQMEMQAINKSREKAAEKANELAKLKMLQLKYREALIYYQQAAELQPDNSLYYNQLGFILYTLGEYGKAIENYEKSLKIGLQVYGEKHSEIAIRYINIGAAWDDLGEHNNAIEYYEMALAIDREVYGEKHPQIANRYNNIGGVWGGLGDHNKAIEFYEKALAIDQEFYGEKHPNIAKYYNNLGATWRELGEYTKAIGYLEKALQIRIEMLGSEHPGTKITIENLKSAREKLDASESK